MTDFQKNELINFLTESFNHLLQNEKKYIALTEYSNLSIQDINSIPSFAYTHSIFINIIKRNADFFEKLPIDVKSNDELIISMIYENPFHIRLIDNPTFEIQSLAISLNPYAIHNIKNSFLDIQLCCLKGNVNLIKNIKDQHDDAKTYALKEAPMLYRHIHHPNKEHVKMIAQYIFMEMKKSDLPHFIKKEHISNFLNIPNISAEILWNFSKHFIQFESVIKSHPCYQNSVSVILEKILE